MTSYSKFGWSGGSQIGPQGPIGPQGSTGPQGAQGAQGNTGPQGSTGPAGGATVVGSSTGSFIFSNGSSLSSTNTLSISGSIVSCTGSFLSDHIYPSINSAFNIGAPTGQYNNIYTSQLYLNGALIDGNTTNVLFSQNILPNLDNTTSLGSTLNRYVAVWAVNGTIQTSDEKTKDDIQDCTLGLDFIRKLEPKTWLWKDGPNTSDRQYGFMYQHLDSLDSDNNFGFLHPATDDGVHGINYTGLLAPLTKSIQEISSLQDDQQSKLDLCVKNLSDLTYQFNLLNNYVYTQYKNLNDLYVQQKVDNDLLQKQMKDVLRSFDDVKTKLMIVMQK